MRMHLGETSCIKQTIREYGSTLYVGMAREKNGRPCISIESGKPKSLLIYTDKLKYRYNL